MRFFFHQLCVLYTCINWFIVNSNCDLFVQGLKDEFMMAVPWENSGICELDITSTELSAECLENFLTRIPYFTYLAAGHTDFFTDHVSNL